MSALGLRTIVSFGSFNTSQTNETVRPLLNPQPPTSLYWIMRRKMPKDNGKQCYPWIHKNCGRVTRIWNYFELSAFSSHITWKPKPPSDRLLQRLNRLSIWLPRIAYCSLGKAQEVQNNRSVFRSCPITDPVVFNPLDPIQLSALTLRRNVLADTGQLTQACLASLFHGLTIDAQIIHHCSRFQELFSTVSPAYGRTL